MLLLTLYPPPPHTDEMRLNASDSRSSRGLTSPTPDLYKPAETDRSANLGAPSPSRRLMLLLLWNAVSVFHYVHLMKCLLDETVIFFTEHSMKLYSFADAARLVFPSALLQCSPLSNNTFYLASSSAVISLPVKLNQNVISFTAVITL